MTKIGIQRIKITHQYLYSLKRLEEIIFVRKDLSGHQELASSVNITCNGKLSESRPLPSCVVASFLEKHF